MAVGIGFNGTFAEIIHTFEALIQREAEAEAGQTHVHLTQQLAQLAFEAESCAAVAVETVYQFAADNGYDRGTADRNTAADG